MSQFASVILEPFGADVGPVPAPLTASMGNYPPNRPTVTASAEPDGSRGDALMVHIHFALMALFKRRLPRETSAERRRVIRSGCGNLAFGAWALKQGYATPRHAAMLRSAAQGEYKATAAMIAKLNN
jgi:hypothetical protein